MISFNALTKQSVAGEIIRLEDRALDPQRPQQHFIEILETVKPDLQRFTRRDNATDIWIAQIVKAGNRDKPAKTPRLTFMKDHRTIADVYKSLIKKGGVGYVHLIADIPYKDPAEETGDAED